jgi:solute carrier family 25 (mitochondrial phosphate transporter), member 3
MLNVLALVLIALKCAHCAGSSILARPVSLVSTDIDSKLKNNRFWFASLAGALSCSVTHTMMVPLDLIKTRIQTDPALAGLSTRQVTRIIRQTEGSRALLEGLSAVGVGYFLQGTAKFGIYDKLKRKLKHDLTKRGEWNEFNKLPVYLAASGIAETVATLLLCPFEVAKIVIMTKKYSDLPSAAGGGKLVYAMQRIVQEGGLTALYRGLPMIMLRQVPYSCVKLASYDLISEQAMKVYMMMVMRSSSRGGYAQGVDRSRSRGLSPPALLTADEPEEGGKPVLVQMVSGMSAGVLAAVLSQPADVILSKLCSGSSGSSGLATAGGIVCEQVRSPADVMRVARNLGVQGAFAGLKQRSVMVGGMTAAQFIIYENVKTRLEAQHFGD